MVGLAAVLVCLILLTVSVSGTQARWTGNCGSVLSPTGEWLAAPEACEVARNSRLTSSLVIGAVGVAAFVGASQVKKREDD